MSGWFIVPINPDKWCCTVSHKNVVFTSQRTFSLY